MMDLGRAQQLNIFGFKPRLIENGVIQDAIHVHVQREVSADERTAEIAR
jgi:hypothetical protein